MQIDSPAIVCTARAHGEHGAVIRLLTKSDGLIAAYVHGSRSRKTKGVLTPGNLVAAELEARGEGRMARARLELETSRAALALDPLSLAMVEWLTMLVADTLPEGETFPDVYVRMNAMLALLDADAGALRVGEALARFEFALLADLGFQLDLGSCAVTGQLDDLIYVSPKSGRAVSRDAGAQYKERLLALPAFLLGSGVRPTGADIQGALGLTRHFILRDLLPTHRADRTIVARDRVDARLGKRF
ncbi:DNA repair protein RecO [Pacificimonas sp. WHA3]|uniref:DNA repair protein RecO n=1 Tax=Pacificimonas pallii TaxID=2827236 RepID=A0ABS6SE43_9SPHN|nr:DNA repair protein RecO [Pacificimonas pallii]